MKRYVNIAIATSMFIIPLCGSFMIGPFMAIKDPTSAKEFLVIMFALAIGILALNNRECRNSGKGGQNVYLYALIMFLPISIYCSPPLKLMFQLGNLGGLWIWKSLAWVFIYWILYEAIIRTDFNKKLVIKAICWAALLTIVYAVIQILGLDQFQFVRDPLAIGHPTSRHITSMIGNPTYLAVWLGMCLPFIFAYMRWPWWILAGFVIISCRSDIGYAGLVCMATLYPAFRASNKRFLISWLVVCIISVCVIAAYWGVISPKIQGNGRFGVWKSTFEDWKSPPITMDYRNKTDLQEAEIKNLNQKTYALTGIGMGSFRFLFPEKHPGMGYSSAHNEHLEILYSIGLIGYVLFMASIGLVLIRSFVPARGDLFLSACYLSFLYSVIAAGGIPLWQTEPLRFQSAMMFIFLSQKK